MDYVKSLIWYCVYELLRCVSYKLLCSVHYWRISRRWIDWENPKDINEKIQWLKFNSDTTSWSRLADKNAAREYVEEKGFGDMLVPLFGRWNRTEDIAWDKLPSQFVMKTNHGSGDVLICHDKNSIDRKEWTKYFDHFLKKKIGSMFGEFHYDRIKPCIIAEQLLDCNSQSIESSSLIDYKIWSFNGKAEYIWVCLNRTKESCDVAVYDTNWIFHPEYSKSIPHYKLFNEEIPRPRSLDQMLNAVSVLSKGYPFVRMDFYEIGGVPYFGEMTFTPAGGFNIFYTQDFLDILGGKCILPKIKIQNTCER